MMANTRDGSDESMWELHAGIEGVPWARGHGMVVLIIVAIVGQGEWCYTRTPCHFILTHLPVHGFGGSPRDGHLICNT